MNEQIMKIVNDHNEAVAALNRCDTKVSEGKVFRAMEVWHKLACEGADITRLAREHGIDAKCNMQTGQIIISGACCPREVQ